jgi:type II secretory pathway pseudopilin PulG
VRRCSFIGKGLHSSTAGYTLLELIIVGVLIGILGAIAAPSWLTFLNLQTLNTGQNQVYRAMQAAQSNAKRDKLTWQTSFQEVTVNDRVVVQWAVHPAKPGTFIPSGVRWNNLGTNLRIDKKKNDKGEYETTLDSPGNKTIEGPWRVQFNYHGNTNGQLGRIALRTPYTGKIKRCVIVSTLIGTVRTAKERPKPNKEGKYCY